jgi:hypothetical protein
MPIFSRQVLTFVVLKVRVTSRHHGPLFGRAACCRHDGGMAGLGARTDLIAKLIANAGMI